MAAFAFFVTVAFWPGWSGAALAPRWALLALIIPWLIPQRVTLTTVHLALYVFTGWLALSFAWTADPLGGVLAFAQWLVVVGCFCVGSGLTDLRPTLRGAALGIGFSSAAAIAQMLGWKGLAQLTVPAGLFVNGNFMAEAAVLVLVGCIAERMWWAIPLTAPAALLPGARGPILALVIALTVWARNKYITVLVVAAIIIAVASSVLAGYRVQSITQRLAMWSDIGTALTWFGHGVGSFYLLYPSIANRVNALWNSNTLIERPEHAHNDGLEIVFEAGLGALLLLPVLFALCRNARGKTAGVVLVAFAVESVGGFPLHLPVTTFIGAIVAGAVCARGVDVRSLFASRRGYLHARRGASGLRASAGSGSRLPL